MAKSIRARFFLVFLSITVVMGGLLAYVVYKSAMHERRTMELRTVHVARATASAARGLLTSIVQIVSEVSAALASETWTSADRQAYIVRVLALHPEFAGIYYVSGEHVIQAGSPHMDANVLRACPTVRDVLQGQSRSLHLVETGPSGSIDVAVPVASSDGKRIGILNVRLAPSAVSSVLTQAPWANVQSYILDDDRRVVSRSVGALSGEMGSWRGLDLCLRGMEVSGPVVSPHIPDGLYYACFAPAPGFGWCAVAVDNMRAALAPMRRLEWQYGELYALLVVLGLFILRVSTGDLMDSIRKLCRAARAVASGDIGYRVRLNTGSEMDVVGSAFNHMAERLQEHQDLLHARNLQLNVLLRFLEELRPDQAAEKLLRRIPQDATYLTEAQVAFVARVDDNVIRLSEWWNGVRWDHVDYAWERGRGVVGWVWLHREPREVNDCAQEPDSAGDFARQMGIRNCICAPILLPNGTIDGVVVVANKCNDAAFSEDDVRITELLARHTGVALEVEASFLRERQIGAILQKALLPDVDVQVAGLTIAHEYHAAYSEAELGGDFYDVIRLSDHEIGLVIADVSGKGLRAAVQTATVKYALRAYALEDMSPSRVLERLNQYCHAGTLNRGFVTLFFGVIDVSSWEMRFANAGHMPPLLRRANGSVDILSCAGVALGVADNSVASFPPARVSLNAGDTLVLYTDGLSEARCGNEFLDIEGLQMILSEQGLSAHDTARTLVERAIEFSDSGLRDDVALLVVQTSGPSPGETPAVPILNGAL